MKNEKSEKYYLWNILDDKKFHEIPEEWQTFCNSFQSLLYN